MKADYGAVKTLAGRSFEKRLEIAQAEVLWGIWDPAAMLHSPVDIQEWSDPDIHGTGLDWECGHRRRPWSRLRRRKRGKY